MWKIKAGSQIKVFAPFGRVGGKSTVIENGVQLTDTLPWKAYTTKEDRLYDKEQVWDRVAVHNQRSDVPAWVKHNLELCAVMPVA